MTQASCHDLPDLEPRLQRRARRLVSDRAAAEDLVQTVLVKLCERLRDGAEIEDLGAYAMRVMQNEAQRVWAEPAREEVEEDMLTALPDALTRLEFAETLKAIAELPEAQQAVLAHVIAGETSPATIAERTGQPMGTVMSRLARARRALRAATDR